MKSHDNKTKEWFNQLAETGNEPNSTEVWLKEWIESEVLPSKKSSEIANNTITNYSDS